MRRLGRAAGLFLVLILLAGVFPTVSLADESNVTYTGNSGDIIFNEDGSGSPQNLFPDFSGVMPGDSLTQTILVRNNADNKVKVKIYLRSSGADTGSAEFLDKLQLTVTPRGKTPVFEGSAAEQDGLSDWTEIGMLYSGGEAVLDVRLDVPIELDNSYQKQSARLHWEFLVIEIPTDEVAWVCPVCGGSHYRIIDHEAYSEYHCEACGHTEDMLCEICGGRMHLVIEQTGDNRVWYHYECNDDSSHRTDPVPKTGDEGHPILWVALSVGSIGLMILVLLWKPRRENDEEAAANK